MRILFYCDTVFSFGGVQRVLAEVAKALCADHRVVILTTDHHTDLMMYGYNESSVQFDYISYSGCPLMEHLLCKAYSFLYKNVLPHTKYTSELYSKSFFPPSYKSKLIQKINEGNYDAVIGVHAYLSLHLASISDKIHAKKIGWMHNSYEAFFEKENPYLPRLKAFFKYQIPKLDKTIVLSHLDQQKYSREMGLETEVIYNPLTLEPAGRTDLKNRKFLSVGRFSKDHKGFDLLIKAFALFTSEDSDWTLDIVGEGPEEPYYRSLIAENRLEDRIKIHPFTKEIHTYYREATVYVLASRWEGMPLVLMEAMAYGLPVVASDIPIAKELMEGKNVALFFEKENVPQLADRLAEIAGQCNLQQMSKNAATYAQTFKINAIIQKWNNIIKR